MGRDCVVVMLEDDGVIVTVGVALVIVTGAVPLAGL
jgi:hypothetical protein